MRDLTVCQGCGLDFVYPVEWEETDPLLWHVTLRCGACDRWETGDWDQATVDAFDVRLDVQTEQLVRCMLTVTRQNLIREIDDFAAALAADLVLPEDF